MTQDIPRQVSLRTFLFLIGGIPRRPWSIYLELVPTPMDGEKERENNGRSPGAIRS